MGAKVKLGADGVWECRLYLGRSLDGKAIRPYKRFPQAKTEEEAQELADAWACDMTAGGLVKSARLSDLLCEYITVRKRNGASPNSIRSYRLFVRYVEKYLKNASARSLGVMDFNEFEQILQVPKSDGGQGLSRNSVLGVHHFLRGAYNFFVDSGICDANPLVSVAKPSLERHEASTVSEWDFKDFNSKLMEALCTKAETGDDFRSEVYAFAAWLSLNTGMRVGEVCAARHCDVYRIKRYVHVGGTVIEEKGRKPYRRDVTKGKKSRNVSVTEDDLEVIARHIELLRAFLGHVSADMPLVTVDGSFMRPTDVSRAFNGIRKACGMPKGVTFHSLRHTHASWLIANGCDLKTLAARLGHADEATTLRIYGHLMPGRDAAAAEMFAEAKKRIGGS